MSEIAVNLPRNAGETGLVLHLFDGDETLDPAGFALTEVPDSFGMFVADAPVVAAVTYRAVVVKSGTPVYDDWLVADSVGKPALQAQAAAVLAAATATPIAANLKLINDAELVPTTDYAKESSVQEAITAINGLEGPGAPTGPGGIPVTIPVSINNQPVDGVAVWITTDPEGTNQIAGILYTNTFGNTQPPFTLEAGIFYVWVQKAGINFTNPQSIQVFENGTYQWYTG